MARSPLAACALSFLTLWSTAASHAQPAENSIAAHGFVAASDDVLLYYEVRGSGPDTVVAIHGGPGLSSAYLAPDLDDLDGYTVIYYDQRGSGQSTIVTDSTRLRLANHVADLEVIRAHFEIDRLTLLGHSWGAGPATFYARDNPDRVSRLILHDPMPMRAAPHMERFGENLRSWMDSTTAARVGELSAARRDPNNDPAEACRAFWAVFIRGYLAEQSPGEQGRQMRGDICGDPPAAIENAGRVYASALGPAYDWDWRRDFGAVRSPVLVLRGAESPIPAEAAQEWIDALPDARLVTIEGAGHFAHLERPEAFRRAVSGFLR